MRSSGSETLNSLQAALSCVEIQETCRRLSQIIDTCGPHHLGPVFQRITEDVFSSRIYKWGLARCGLSPSDSACIRIFLGIHGSMFRLIDRMQQHGVQAKGPDLIIDGFRNGSNDAFQAYFSRFAQHIIKPVSSRQADAMFLSNKFNVRNPSFSTTVAEDSLYFVLLDEYLGYYFPAAVDTKPPTLNIIGTFKTSGAKPHHNITRSSLLLRHDLSKPTSIVQTSHGEMWCCDILMGIFSTFWFDDYQSNKNSSSSGGTGLPSENHIRAVRLLVKHVHYFCNAHLESTLEKRLQNDSVLEQVNQNIVNMFQPKLLLFLIYCFDAWPLDHTFRIVLETWLSYIQPWRYVRNQGSNADMGAECSVNNNWYHFVYTNIKFYTTLFQVVIKRFIRMDISTTANSLLLFRVAKIYNQTNLITLIDQAEESTPSFCQVSRNYNSYIVQSFESAAPKEDEMFSPAFTNIIKQLLVIISQALETMKISATNGDSDWSNRAMAFLGYGALVEDRNPHPVPISDRKKTEQHLNYALKVFSDMYEIPIPKSSGSFGKGSDEIADHVVDGNGKISLSPTGRYQLQNNLKKFPVIVNADPDLRPICSYENAYLVRFFHSVSNHLNTSYQTEIESMCRKKTISGKICKILFLPNAEHPELMHDSHLRPRVRLRFLAHYKILFYVAGLYILSSLFGFSFLSTCLYLFFMFVVVVVLKALFSKD